jgi:3-deoxy-7-phosphoheptulonate synthase
MIVTVREHEDPTRVKDELQGRGLWVQSLRAGARTFFIVEAHSQAVDPADLEEIPGVETVAVGASGHPRIDAQPAVVQIGKVAVGPGAAPVVIAGPCSVESELQVLDIARALPSQGVRFLRGGAYKPRSSPYAFQGHGARALRWLRDAADRFGLQVVTEATGAEEVPAVAEVADLIQVGSRSMHAAALLKTIGRTGKPVLLKRGMSATVEEWLLAGECLLLHGASAVVFCERGLRSYDPSTRNLLDLGAVALLAHVHHLPVIVDPSHAAGRRDLILPLAHAGLAAGACGVMVETHPHPAAALSDGPQALPMSWLSQLHGSHPVPEAAHG